VNPFREHEQKAHWVDIYVAGDAAVARQVCREHCMKIVRLVNYPRFPCSDAELDGKAQALAMRLADALCQWSVLIQTPKKATWLDRKPPEPNRS
jgi:hypothetical protein